MTVIGTYTFNYIHMPCFNYRSIGYCYYQRLAPFISLKEVDTSKLKPYNEYDPNYGNNCNL